LLSSLLDDSPEELSPEPLLAVVEVVDVVEVEVVCAAAFSALVSVGGVMSGALFGVTSETLLPPPQAARVKPQSKSRAVAVIAARAARGEGRPRTLLTRRMSTQGKDAGSVACYARVLAD
jgi:hypothetical protein